MISDDQIQRMRNAPPREVCEHGSQKVKCAHCDNIALEAEISALRSQLAEVDGSNHLPDLARLSMVELNATAMRKSLNQDNDLMAAYIHRIVELEQRAERAEAERDALKQDAERLNWLERLGFSALFGSEYLTARDAIDAARTQENRRGEE